MLRSLIHHWRVNLAVAAGAAVSTAVLAGAVIVGDSLESSLRRLTLDRLGDIEHAVLGQEPFRAELVEALALEIGRPARVAPLMIASASALATESRALAAGVNLFGIDERFAAMFPGEPAGTLDLGRVEGQIFPSVILNRSLAREIDVVVGDDVLLSFEPPSDIPRASLLGNRPAEGAVTGLRGTVRAVIPDRGPGRFDLASHQELSLSAFVELDVLQSRLDRSGEINAVLLADTGGAGAQAELATALDRAVDLEDLGLEAEGGPETLAISNRRFVLRDTTSRKIGSIADAWGVSRQIVLGYLANRLELNGHTLPYSMILGLDLPVSEPLGTLIDIDGAVIEELGDNRIVLGAWAAEDLAAEPGDTVEVIYFAVGRDDDLETRRIELEVAAVADMSGLMVRRRGPAALPRNRRSRRHRCLGASLSDGPGPDPPARRGVLGSPWRRTQGDRQSRHRAAALVEPVRPRHDGPPRGTRVGADGLSRSARRRPRALGVRSRGRASPGPRAGRFGRRHRLRGPSSSPSVSS